MNYDDVKCPVCGSSNWNEIDGSLNWEGPDAGSFEARCLQCGAFFRVDFHLEIEHVELIEEGPEEEELY